MATRLLNTVDLSDTENWLSIRQQGIGGSDAASSIGMSRWKSPFQLWLEKTGQSDQEDLSDNEYIYWGSVLEQAVSDRFCELSGKKVRKTGLWQSDKNKFMLASPDRMVVGENAGLECKTANGFAAKDWADDEIPTQYYIQCQHYMSVMDCEKWYIACLLGGNHFILKEIPRNDEDIKALAEGEKTFWDMVKNKTMPQVDGSENCARALNTKFIGGQTEPVTLDKEAADIITRLDALKTSEADIKAAVQENKNRLCTLLGDNEIGYAGDRKITWKTQAGRITVDTKKLKAEMPDIHKKYSKSGSPIRVLRF